MKKLIKKLESLKNITFVEVKRAQTLYGVASTTNDTSNSWDVSNSFDTSNSFDYSLSND